MRETWVIVRLQKTSKIQMLRCDARMGLDEMIAEAPPPPAALSPL